VFLCSSVLESLVKHWRGEPCFIVGNTHTAAPNLHLNLLTPADPSPPSSWNTKPFPLCGGLYKCEGARWAASRPPRRPPARDRTSEDVRQTNGRLCALNTDPGSGVWLVHLPSLLFWSRKEIGGYWQFRHDKISGWRSSHGGKVTWSWRKKTLIRGLKKWEDSRQKPYSYSLCRKITLKKIFECHCIR